jgi:hypothetical protein
MRNEMIVSLILKKTEEKIEILKNSCYFLLEETGEVFLQSR